MSQWHPSEKANLNIKLSPAEQEKETAWEERQEILDAAPEHPGEGSGCRGASKHLFWKAEPRF